METRCPVSPALGALAGVELFLKRDHEQVTGSFKERGAAHALLRLDHATRRRGVVAASAGNHALGLARHGDRLGVPVTLVMPVAAARVKVERCRALRANVVLAGATYDEAEVVARALAAERGLSYVHPFDDADVIAGQGTMGLEIVEQAPGVEVVFVPVGGGGLLAGVASAVKTARPAVRVIAVEPLAAASYAAAYAAGAPAAVAVGPTLADGLSVARIGAIPWAVSRGLVDGVVTVSEREIARAMVRLFEHERTVVEGAGAVALAGALSGRCAGLAGARVAVPLTGANVDATRFAEALRSGGEESPAPDGLSR